jgi:hypothetical protein
MIRFFAVLLVLVFLSADASAFGGRRAARKAQRSCSECTACAQAPAQDAAPTAAQVVPNKVAEGTPFYVPSRVATQTTFRLYSRSTSTCPNGQCPK